MASPEVTRKMLLLHEVKRRGDEVLRQLHLDSHLIVMEKKSFITYQHSVQVAVALVEQFIEHDFIEEDFLVQAYVAALLHDIGKLRPDLLALVNSDEPFRLDSSSQKGPMLTKQHSRHGRLIIQRTVGGLELDDFMMATARVAAVTAYAHHLELHNILSSFPGINEAAQLCVLGTRAIDMVQASTDLDRKYVAAQVVTGQHDFMGLRRDGEVTIDREKMRGIVVRGLGRGALVRFPVLGSIIENVNFPQRWPGAQRE